MIPVAARGRSSWSRRRQRGGVWSHTPRLSGSSRPTRGTQQLDRVTPGTARDAEDVSWARSDTVLRDRWRKRPHLSVGRGPLHFGPRPRRADSLTAAAARTLLACLRAAVVPTKAGCASPRASSSWAVWAFRATTCCPRGAGCDGPRWSSTPPWSSRRSSRWWSSSRADPTGPRPRRLPGRPSCADCGLLWAR